MAFHHLFTANSQRRHWSAILAIFALSVLAVNLQLNTQMLKGSLLSVPDHKPFDGTVTPLEEVPDWSNLASSRTKLEYADYESSELTALPVYDNAAFTTPFADLKWGNADDAKIRNTKLTYPVPYAGNYELDDCGEGCGSHPAVDIKAPKGTPVRVIANGTVTDAGVSSTWGDYVVVEHKDVPNPISPSQTTNLYSVYAHLSELFVEKDDVLEKGTVIGKVGDTGTATTYHLHFQIDADNAPWHPYWPFTTADAKAAGYNFWEAVSAGVGRDNVYAYTVNPMEFVQDHLNDTGNSSDSKTTSTKTKDKTPKNTDTTSSSSSTNSSASSSNSTSASSTSSAADAKAQAAAASAAPEDDIGANFDHFELTSNYFALPGDDLSMYVRLLDQNNKLVGKGSFKGEITLSVSDEDVATLNHASVDSGDFDSGRSKLELYAKHAGEVTVTATLDHFYETSFTVYVVDHIEPFAQFGISTDGSFVPNKAETIQVQALDLSGNPTPSFSGDASVELSVVQGSGTLTPSRLDKSDFPTGIAQVQFTADSEDPVILRVTYGKKTWDSDTMESTLFSDYDSNDDYFPAVSYLFKKGTVSGYPDGSFQPDRTVSRVEALKFVFAGTDQKVKANSTAQFKDTSLKEWYAPYLATAYTRGIVQGYPDGHFKPTQGVNRAEFLKILFATVDISVDPVVAQKPYNDVDTLAWYAPYVQYAKAKNLFPISGKEFKPSDPMSRSEVAEVIYRLLAVRQNSESSYSVLLKPSL